jgi:hypothetical protein
VFAICFVEIHAIESYDGKGKDHLQKAKGRVSDIRHRELDFGHFRVYS